MTTRLALIGYGAMGRAHAMGYRDIVHHYGLPADAVKIVAVATTRAESARPGGRRAGLRHRHHRLARRLSRVRMCDVIDICTPHDSARGTS